MVPSRTLISPAVKSFGCTCSSASTLRAYAGSFSAASLALFSLSRTRPDRYSSAVCQPAKGSLPESGSLKITPARSRLICSIFSLLPAGFRSPIRLAMNPKSTQAFSPMETARASDAVSTLLTAIYGLMVRLWNISALRSRLPFSSSTSREDKRGKLLSGEKAVLLARLLISPYFAVKPSYRRPSSRCSRSTMSSGAFSV